MFKNIKLNIFRPILVILILFIPLYPKFPLLAVNGTYVAIRLDDLVVMGAVLVLVIDQICRKFPILKEKITPLMAAYFIAIGLSTINAILVFQTDSTNILILNWLRRAEYMTLFFIGFYAVKNKTDIKYSVVAMLVMTVGVILYGFGQKYWKFPVISTMNEEFSQGRLLQMDIWTRISSTFAGHYDLAAYMSVALIMILFVFFKAKVWWQKLPVIIIWLFSFYVLTLTASRISIFAFWGGVILMLILIRKYIWIIPVSLLVVFSMINSKDLNQRLLATIPSLKKQVAINTQSASPTPTLALPTPTPDEGQILPTPIIGKISTPTPTVFRHQAEQFPEIDADVGVARSGEIRFNVEWPRAINAFKKNLLVGTGLGSITLATDNDYLRLLGESGILGFFTFMTILLYFIVETWPSIWKKGKLSENDSLKLMLLSCLLAVMANATFIDIFEASKPAYLFWIMMGIYYRIISSNKDE